VQEQKRWLEKNLSEKPFINMDWVTAEHGSPIHVSRLFRLSDAQFCSNELIPRPGASSFEDIFPQLIPNNYLLVDDDIATGFSMKTLEALLPDGIKVSGHISLLKQWLHEKFPNKDYHPWDIVDARDFILGAHNSGLVVQDFNNNVRRVPYILPYVSLMSRAAVPYDQQKKLTIAILRGNLQFFESLDHQILLEDTDETFKNFMADIGFKMNTPLSSLCKWHLEKLVSNH
jgi:hypothetical protein